MINEKVDILVIGAGPSGTVAASILNKAGFKTKIIEKERFPRFVIGESLLPKCMEAFEAAGFLEIIKAEGYQQKFGARFVNPEKKVMDFNFSNQFTKGWEWTWQVPRANFDELLAREVEKMGVEVEYETVVTGILFEKDYSVSTVMDTHGKERTIEARFIVDASGYGRVIPKLFNLDKPSGLPARRTLFAHVTDKKRSNYIDANRILIIDHKPGVWAWAIPFSNGITSCGFVGNPVFFDDFKGSATEQLRQIIASEWSIAERFENADFVFEPKTLTGWSVSTNKFYGNGFVLTGNVTEFLDPIFSSGVTLAVTSSHLAANLVMEQLLGSKPDWQRDYTDKMMYGIDTFRSYVNAWYDGTLQKIFFSDDHDPEVTRQICSVLAGYVWDEQNPYVKHHKTALGRLVRLIELSKKMKGGK